MTCENGFCIRGCYGLTHLEKCSIENADPSMHVKMTKADAESFRQNCINAGCQNGTEMRKIIESGNFPRK